MAPRKKRHEYTMEQRTQILLLKGQGLTEEEIAKKLQISRSGVGACWRRTAKRGTIAFKHRSGRPKKDIESALHHAKLDLRRGRIKSAKEILHLVQQESGQRVSLNTIKNRMHDEGYRAFKVVRKPLVSRKQRQRRVKLARRWFQNGENFWRTVIFTDETQINRLSTGYSSYVYLPKNFPFTQLRMKPTASHGGGSLNLWLAICPVGILAHTIFDGGLDAKSYVKIVKTKLVKAATEYFGEDDWILQADNDPAHTARTTIEQLEELGESRGFTLLPWPAHSPDLNPVENCIAQLKDLVSHSPPSTSITELQALVEAKIDLLNQPANHFFFENLYRSMHDRCFQVIKAHGFPTTH